MIHLKVFLKAECNMSSAQLSWWPSMGEHTCTAIVEAQTVAGNISPVVRRFTISQQPMYFTCTANAWKDVARTRQHREQPFVEQRAHTLNCIQHPAAALVHCSTAAYSSGMHLDAACSHMPCRRSRPHRPHHTGVVHGLIFDKLSRCC